MSILRQGDRQSDTWLRFGVGVQWKAVNQEFLGLELQGGWNGSGRSDSPLMLHEVYDGFLQVLFRMELERFLSG